MREMAPAEWRDQSERLINHLMFHKALIDEERDGSRIDRYLELLEEDGQHLTIHDPFDKSIAIAFELAIDHHLDPWDLDLVQFSTLYLKRARDEEIDLVTAGRIILMAWQVLRLQSQEVVTRAEKANEPEPDEGVLPWDAIPDWTFDPAERDFTQTVLEDDDPPLEEPVRRPSSRRVSLFELVEAFDEARQEAEHRMMMARERELARAARRDEVPDDDSDRMHTDDLEAEIAQTWDRINGFNGQPIPLKRLFEANKDDLLRTLISVLFLAKDERITVWQETFPHGDIFIENREQAAG